MSDGKLAPDLSVQPAAEEVDVQTTAPPVPT